MKYFKILIAALLSAVLIASIYTPAFAVTIINYGDYSFSANGDSTYMLYSYNGTDKELELPDNIMGLEVVGIYDNCFKNSDIKTVLIPDTYTYIGKSAFYGCNSLSSITIPQNVAEIGEMAFSSCENLAVFKFEGKSKIKTIPYSAFYGDASLTDFVVPSGVTEISSYAFAKSGLRSISISNTVRTIGEYAFRECANLSKAALPEQLTEVSDYCFYSCNSLETVDLPINLTSIGDRAFAECSALKEIQLPPYLESIGKYAFYNASSLSGLFIPDSVTAIGAEALNPMSYSNTITVSYYEGSYAQDYCYDNYVKNVVAYSKLIGDANLDGKINILDVTSIQKYKIGDEDLSYRAVGLADVNRDNSLTIRDATLIQMYLAKMIEEF